jgi:two-component system, sensor histidine kinase RegB
MPQRSQGDALRINLAWTIRLRWGAMLGQLATIVFVDREMAIDLPILLLMIPLALELATNLGLQAWLTKKPVVQEWHLGALQVLDVLLLTALLYLTGGPFNPFVSLYLVHIALSAALLSASWTSVVALLSLLCGGALFLNHVWLKVEHPHNHGHLMRMHLEGMWVAMAIAAAFVGYFVTRIRRALADADRELDVARERATRSEELSTIATIAAGAAHELSTPLSTIAVATKELQAHVGDRAGAEASADLELIRSEVERCRAVLTRMVAAASDGLEEPQASISVGELIEQSRQGLAALPPIRLSADKGTLELPLQLPRHSVVASLRAILKNAQEASTEADEVVTRVSRDGSTLQIAIEDRGTGMDGETVRRVGQPFFTTKPTGHGMGLGLFLAEVTMERLGADLAIESVLARGTTVRLSIPL